MLNKFSIYKHEISSHIYTKARLHLSKTYALQNKNSITHERK